MFIKYKNTYFIIVYHFISPYIHNQTEYILEIQKVQRKIFHFFNKKTFTIYNFFLPHIFIEVKQPFSLSLVLHKIFCLVQGNLYFRILKLKNYQKMRANYDSVICIFGDILRMAIC